MPCRVPQIAFPNSMSQVIISWTCFFRLRNEYWEVRKDKNLRSAWIFCNSNIFYFTYSVLFYFKRVSSYNICFYWLFYHQIKIPISFWCSWRLNPRFLFQPSETLSIKLIRTHHISYSVLLEILICTISSDFICWRSYHLILAGNKFFKDICVHSNTNRRTLTLSELLF